MSNLRRFLVAIRRLAGSLVSLALLGTAAPSAEARDMGAPTNFDQRSKYRYSFEYYRHKGVSGRSGERLSPNDPRGHMSGGHGGGHL